MEYDGPEQQLELFRTIVRQPQAGLRSGAQKRFLLCPVDPGRRKPGKLAICGPQTMEAGTAIFATILSPDEHVKFRMTIVGQVTLGDRLSRPLDRRGVGDPNFRPHGFEMPDACRRWKWGRRLGASTLAARLPVTQPDVQRQS